MTDFDSQSQSGQSERPERQYDGPPQYNYGRRPPPPPPPGEGPSWRMGAFNNCMVAGCVTILAPVLLLGGFFALMAYVLSTSIDEVSTGKITSFVQPSGSLNLRQRLLRSGDAGAGTIAVVTVHGAIDGKGSTLGGEGNMGFIAQQLRQAGNDDGIKAVILQIDSPGGTLHASDQVHNEIQILRRKGKPVLAWTGGMMLSGGYYVAVAADKIMAGPTATIGSIGVILQHFQVAELLQKIGVEANTLKSGEHKDIGSMFRDMTPEERQVLQNYIDESQARFVSLVAKGRDMPEDKARALADGSFFSAEKAKSEGLVDFIGYIGDAVEWSEKASNQKNMRIIGYRRLVSFSDFLSEAGAGAASTFMNAVKREAKGTPAVTVY